MSAFSIPNLPPFCPYRDNEFQNSIQVCERWKKLNGDCRICIEKSVDCNVNPIRKKDKFTVEKKYRFSIFRI